MALTQRVLVLSATAAAVTGVAITGAGIHSSKVSAILQDNPKELVDEVWQMVNNQYLDATFGGQDWSAVRKTYLSRPYKDKKEAYEAIREMLKPLNDAYTRFMDPDEYNNMKIDTSGELMGVGIELASDEKTKKLTVVAPIENTPAAKAGILAKDVIIKIDGKSTEGMDTKTAVQLIRGPKGTTVTLTIQRGQELLNFPLTRDRIEIHPVRFHTDTLPQGKTIGYIRLVQFSQPAVEEMRQAIRELESQQVQGYILDLRSNPGGLLHASVDIARMWLKQGTIVSTVTRQGEVDRQKANNTALTNKPLVILVDGGSASASEIVSGALQDNKRGKIVGLQTFGKGLVQSVMPLRSDEGQSAMAITIAGYRTPNGRDIHKHGIDPDVEVKLTDQQRQELSQNRDKVGTSADPQFAKAVEVLLQEIGVASAKTKSSS